MSQATLLEKLSSAESSFIKEIFRRGIENSAKALHYLLNKNVEIIDSKIINSEDLAFDRAEESGRTILKASMQGDISIECYCLVDQLTVTALNSRQESDSPDIGQDHDIVNREALKTIRYLIDAAAKQYSSLLDFRISECVTEQQSAGEAILDLSYCESAVILQATIQITKNNGLKSHFDLVWFFGEEFIEEIEYMLED